MLYLTCTTITSVDLAHYGVSRARDWVSVDVVQVRDRAWFVRLFGEIIDRTCAQRGLSLQTGAQTMLYLTCTIISSVDLAQ